jgi:hypothetical protein
MYYLCFRYKIIFWNLLLTLRYLIKSAHYRIFIEIYCMKIFTLFIFCNSRCVVEYGKCV